MNKNIKRTKEILDEIFKEHHYSSIEEFCEIITRELKAKATRGFIEIEIDLNEKIFSRSKAKAYLQMFFVLNKDKYEQFIPPEMILSGVKEEDENKIKEDLYSITEERYKIYLRK